MNPLRVTCRPGHWWPFTSHRLDREFCGHLVGTVRHGHFGYLTHPGPNWWAVGISLGVAALWAANGLRLWRKSRKANGEVPADA